MVFDAVNFDCCLAVDNVSCLFHVRVSMRDGPGMALYVAINDFHELRSVHAGSDQSIVFSSAMVGRAVRGDIFGAQDVLHASLSC